VLLFNVDDQKKVANPWKSQLLSMCLAPDNSALNPEYPEYFSGLPAKPLLM
jgi:hypothetical protein